MQVLIELGSFILQVLPPPNVTGALHIGHALTAAVEVLWFPKILFLCFTSFTFLAVF